MNTRIIADEDVETLCTSEESHFLDFKSSDVSGKKIQKTIVAFANADGGELLIGIKDPKEESNPTMRWSGKEKIEDLNSCLQAISAVTPTPDLKFEFLKCNTRKGYVLRVLVEKSSFVHYTSDNVVYQRCGAQSLPLNDPQKITELSFAKGAMSFEDFLLKEIQPEQIVYSSELTRFLLEYSPKTDPLEFCINQNLFDFKTWEPRIVSVLLFHDSPSAVIPRKCAVKITRYETREDTPEREHLAEQYTIEGSLYQLIHKAVKKITQIMSSVSAWTLDGLKTMDYPPEAVWEVFVNAVIHRDYSISDDIQVIIYNNRIEMISPGKLPGYVTEKNILDARYARNPKIIRTLNRYKEAPNKDLGEGLNTTFQKMKEWGLQAPLIHEDGNTVKVILPHIPLAQPAEAILKFFKKNNTITNKQAREITGIKSENLVKIEFYKLRDAGYLERCPNLEGPSAAWRLTEAGKIESQKYN
ncbi:MAG: transcriptional regulator [Lentisphaerae bacterium GWF2_44_16]|nr:MAG: transcriptional regulator [Lentisphaerae bacterium GWF2_44_16]